MITESSMYWITRCDAISAALLAMTIISGVFFVICMIGMCLNSAEGNDKWEIKCTNGAKYMISAFVLFLLATVFMPTTRDMCAIKVIPAVLNSTSVGETLSGAKELALDWMKAQKAKLERDAQEVKK